MKEITCYATYRVNGKELIILSNNYKGSPSFMHKYDIIIGSKEIFAMYSKELFPKHLLDRGWIPIVRYLD